MAGVKVYDSVYLTDDYREALRAIGREDLIQVPGIADESDEALQAVAMTPLEAARAPVEVGSVSGNKCFPGCSIL